MAARTAAKVVLATDAITPTMGEGELSVSEVGADIERLQKLPPPPLGLSQCSDDWQLEESLHRLGQFRGAVGFFPGELGLAAAEVAAGRRLAEDRPTQIEILDDPAR